MNKVAVVTGSSKGIGFAIAEKLLSLNYKVYGISRSKTKINNLNLVNLNFDLTNFESIEKLVSQIKEDKIDVLVNNAGTAIIQDSMEFTKDAFDETFALNFIVPIQLTQSLLKKISNSTVINISSLSDRIPENSVAMYCASKAALNIYFDSISTKYNEIRILHILPSYVDTPLLHRLVDEEGWEIEWNKVLKPDHIADLVVRLLGKSDVPNNSKIMALTNYLLEDRDFKEKLFVYNADDKSLEKIS